MMGRYRAPVWLTQSGAVVGPMWLLVGGYSAISNAVGSQSSPVLSRLPEWLDIALSGVVAVAGGLLVAATLTQATLDHEIRLARAGWTLGAVAMAAYVVTLLAWVPAAYWWWGTGIGLAGISVQRLVSLSRIERAARGAS